MKLHPDDIFEQDLSGRRQAVFSPCRQYRYVLTRAWDPKAGEREEAVAFVGLNPSTADAFLDDPTIRRCVGFAKRWGYSKLIMLNMFAFRATNPLVMKGEENPTGPRNWLYLKSYTEPPFVGCTVCCWGANVDDMESSLVIYGWGFIQRPTFCLGLTKSGMPKHPLYVNGQAQMQAYNRLPLG